MTIIMVIHQPRFSIFTLFDTVLLLAKGGRTAYLGPSLQAMEYFTSHGFDAPLHDNPADWLMDVISGDVKSNAENNSSLAEMWKASDFTAKPLSDGATAPVANRAWTFVDDKIVVEGVIEAEWDKIDRDK